MCYLHGFLIVLLSANCFAAKAHEYPPLTVSVVNLYKAQIRDAYQRIPRKWFGPRYQTNVRRTGGLPVSAAGDYVDSQELRFEFRDNTQISQGAQCIGAHSLKLLPRNKLVFEQDALVNVLCDMNKSCATPGHMVIYKGRAMMMSSYCEMAGCTRNVMRVNSPKYSRRLIVPSETEDLMFTALAARFATRAEEGLLSAAVRLGL